MYKTTGITEQELIRSYDHIFADSENLRDSDALYRWILGKLRPRPGTRLLDVACGMGLLLRYAREWGVRTYGIDISRKATERSRAESPESEVFVANGETLPFPDGYFDYITNLGSLEHFINPRQGLAEMKRILKDDGTAAIYLPNSYYLVDILWTVMRTGYSVSHRQVLERFATYNEWGDFLKENGLEVIKGYGYNHRFPRTLADWKWLRRHPKRIFLALAAPFVPFHLSYHFLYLCKKAGPERLRA
jgi:ubiquinone/menaquinone biosynthesis C-methylase UbiE